MMMHKIKEKMNQNYLCKNCNIIHLDWNGNPLDSIMIDGKIMTNRCDFVGGGSANNQIKCDRCHNIARFDFVNEFICHEHYRKKMETRKKQEELLEKVQNLRIQNHPL